MTDLSHLRNVKLLNAAVNGGLDIEQMPDLVSLHGVEGTVATLPGLWLIVRSLSSLWDSFSHF